MSTLTKIYTKPIVKIEMGLTFELDEEKVVILEEGLLYRVQYVAPNNSGDSTNVLKEIVGRISKIDKVPARGNFNPFYNGDIYNITFDCSVEFFSTQIIVPTTQIRDIDLYIISSEEEEDNGEGNSGTDGEISGDAGNTEENITPGINGDETGTGPESGNGESEETDGTTGEGDGGSEGDDVPTE